MKKFALVALAFVVLAVPMVGCYGPQKLNRSLDDWANQGYVETPWLYGNVLSYAVLSVANGLTWWIDGFVNVYYFWVDDAQPFGKGSGTPFDHKAIVPAKK